MEVVVVTYKCKKGMRDAFLEAIQAEGLDAASRAEEGNSRYAYFKPVEGADELLLLETWADEEAVKIHGEAAHYKRLGELKAEYVEETILERYHKDA